MPDFAPLGGEQVVASLYDHRMVRGVRRASGDPTADGQDDHIRVREMIAAPLERWEFLPGPVLGAAVAAGLSLMPSLMPHSAVIQGLVTGVSAALGYAFGVLSAWLICWAVGAEQPWRSDESSRRSIYAGSAIGLLVMLLLGKNWQDDLRSVMGVPNAGYLWYPIVLMITFVVVMLLIAGSRAMRHLANWIARRVARSRPESRSQAVGVAGATLIGVVAVSAVLGLAFLLIRGIFHERDGEVDPAVAQPASQLVSGSTRSVIPWDALGADGRRFISAVPTSEDLTQFSGATAMEPIRVYAGVATSDNARLRADAAVRDLSDFGAFDRAVLVVATSTGTGWVDQTAIAPLEYMYNGNSAVVATQYSTLPSWLSFLVDRTKAREAGQALFEAVYARWQQEPVNQRPRLFVYGESLGSYGAESAFTGPTDMVAKADGALLVGPPAVSPIHSAVTQARDPGSPQWQPIFQEGASVRFASQPTDLDALATPWGAGRVVYMQNASDPVVFWTPSLIGFRPDWLAEAPGPDRWARMGWVPGLTFIKVTGDMMDSTFVEAGHGHVYGANQIGAWARIAAPLGWSEADTARLTAMFE